MENWLNGSVDHWRKVCPQLPIGKKHKKLQEIALNDATLNDLKNQMMQNGVFRLESIISQELCKKLANGVNCLLSKGYPASFIILYDPVWEVVQIIQKVLQLTTSKRNVMNFDILSWHIDPSRDQSGFSPHRDRQPQDVSASFFTSQELSEDERNSGHDATLIPKYSTCWLALTRATPENSCLYMLPKPSDPGYAAGDNHDDPRDPLEVAINGNKEVYQNITAFPLEVGSAVMFSHRILHWGSKGRAGYPEPRISLSFAVSEPGYEAPYLNDADLNPSFEMRLALASAQMLIYHERFNFSPEQLHAFYKCFSSQKDKFNPVYQRQVEKEFVDAVKEVISTEDDTNEDAFDAALDAMLDNVMEGGDVDDDFCGSGEESAGDSESDDEKSEDLPIFGNDDDDTSGQITAEKFAELASFLNQQKGEELSEEEEEDDEAHGCCGGEDSCHGGMCDDPKERLKMIVGAIREIYEISQEAKENPSEDDEEEALEGAMTYERFGELTARARNAYARKEKKSTETEGEDEDEVPQLVGPDITSETCESQLEEDCCGDCDEGECQLAAAQPEDDCCGGCDEGECHVSDPKFRMKRFAGAIREVYELSKQFDENQEGEEDQSGEAPEGAMTYTRFVELAKQANAAFNRKRKTSGNLALEENLSKKMKWHKINTF
jgi:hypothetical protein